jgi:hypothetical protein
MFAPRAGSSKYWLALFELARALGGRLDAGGLEAYFAKGDALSAAERLQWQLDCAVRLGAGPGCLCGWCGKHLLDTDPYGQVVWVVRGEAPAVRLSVERRSCMLEFLARGRAALTFLAVCGAPGAPPGALPRELRHLILGFLGQVAAHK